LLYHTRQFTIEKGILSAGTHAYVAFGNIQEIARVIVNGKDWGIIWIPPYQADITEHIKQGINEIQVQVTNTWNNRIVGDWRNPEKLPYTRTNAKSKFNAKSALLPSGLIGKAEIYFIK